MIRRAWVYELIDDHNKCVYIGVTTHPGMRMDYHRQSTKCFKEMRPISLFLTEAEAFRQESILIRKMCPIYNKRGNPAYSWEVTAKHRSKHLLSWLPDAISPPAVPTVPSTVDEDEYAAFLEQVDQDHKSKTPGMARREAEYRCRNLPYPPAIHGYDGPPTPASKRSATVKARNKARAKKGARFWASYNKKRALKQAQTQEAK